MCLLSPTNPTRLRTLSNIPVAELAMTDISDVEESPATVSNTPTKTEQDDPRLPFKRGLALSSLCSETASETSSSSSDNDDDNDCIQLIQRRRRSKPCSQNFASALQAPSSELVLPGFIERATRHDIYALRNCLLQDDCPIRSLRIEDQAHATNFRRFAYKKENVNHHIQRICLTKNIALDYQIRLDLDVDDLSVDSALSLLQEVKKHPEVRQLQITGHLTPTQEATVLKTLTSLLRLDDRDWTLVNVYTGFVSSSHNNDSSDDGTDYEAWRSTMERYMEVFSRLYTQYNIPIDIRPCAVH